MIGRKMLFVALLLWMAGNAAAQGVGLAEWSTGGTLRIDCLRCGSAQGDTVWVHRWIDRGAEWHGSPTQPIDPFDNGDYRVVVREVQTHRVLYSRGYSNLFREYKDTPEGRSVERTFEEVLLVPMPSRCVEVALQQRDSAMRLVDQHVALFDPATTHLLPLAPAAEAIDLELHGPAANKVDVVIVAQGYDTDTARAHLQADLRRMTEILFGQEPFRSHRADFNVRAVEGNAGAAFGAFGIDRYMMTFDLFHLHDLVGRAPADYVIVMVNSPVYGGGAIYNFYSVSTLHTMADYVLPHEFGHCFGGLADEYVDEDLSYADLHRTPYEPLEPNITNLVDFASKWAGMLAVGEARVTPPDESVPRGECGPLGLYEGAGYSAKGVYRPTMRCMMRDYAPFCPVCARRLEGIFSLYTH